MFFFVLACGLGEADVSTCPCSPLEPRRTASATAMNPYLGALGLLERLLHHVDVGLADPADPEVDARAHLLDLDPRQALSALLGLDHVAAQVDLGRGRILDLLGHGNVHHVLQTLDVDVVNVLALEKVEQQALGQGVGVCGGAVKGGAGKGDERLEADAGLVVFELAEGAEGVGLNVQLGHVEDLVVKQARQRDRVRPLLAVRAKHHERGVVLLREKLERRRVLERVQRVLLCEFLAQRALQRVQVRHAQVDYLRRRRVAQEQRHFGVFVHLRRLLVEGALAAGILGFAAESVSNVILLIPRRRREGGKRRETSLLKLTLVSASWLLLLLCVMGAWRMSRIVI